MNDQLQEGEVAIVFMLGGQIRGVKCKIDKKEFRRCIEAAKVLMRNAKEALHSEKKE